MIGKDQLERLASGNVLDNQGNKIGSVGQVYLDDLTEEPSWVTVRTGLFGTSETFVPLEGARFEGDDIVVPYEKDMVKDAPRVDADQHLDVSEEQELYRYYGRDYAMKTRTTEQDLDEPLRQRLRRHAYDGSPSVGQAGGVGAAGAVGGYDSGMGTQAGMVTPGMSTQGGIMDEQPGGIGNQSDGRGMQAGAMGTQGLGQAHMSTPEMGTEDRSTNGNGTMGTSYASGTPGYEAPTGGMETPGYEAGGGYDTRTGTLGMDQPGYGQTGAPYDGEAVSPTIAHDDQAFTDAGRVVPTPGTPGHSSTDTPGTRSLSPNDMDIQDDQVDGPDDEIRRSLDDDRKY